VQVVVHARFSCFAGKDAASGVLQLLLYSCTSNHGMAWHDLLSSASAYGTAACQ
jgi:hypothetical protein